MNKKTKKIILVTILTILMVVIFGIKQITFAAFADYDDETAEKETQNLIEKQEEEQENVVGKSTNNYLSQLSVQGYKISPEFDKQTQDYNIEGEVDTDKIKIEAIQEDSRAKVSGEGEVELKAGENKIRIDVTAENGTVRTYFINVNRQGKIEETNNTNEEIENTYNLDSIQSSTTNKQTNTSSNEVTKPIIIIIAIIVILVIVAIFMKSSKNKK